MYFGSEESEIGCLYQWLDYGIYLDAESLFTPQKYDSKMMKFITTKSDRHLEFILEAGVETFPQSLLQIIAIVYYQEANYISIVPISLSMFSVYNFHS